MKIINYHLGQGSATPEPVALLSLYCGSSAFKKIDLNKYWFSSFGLALVNYVSSFMFRFFFISDYWENYGKKSTVRVIYN